ASVKHTADAVDQTTVIQLMEPHGAKKLQNEQGEWHELLRGDTFARPYELYTTSPLREAKSSYGLAAEMCANRFFGRGAQGLASNHGLVAAKLISLLRSFCDKVARARRIRCATAA